MGHPQVPKIVARSGTASLFYPDFRLPYCRVCDTALHCLRVPDPHTRTADTRTPLSPRRPASQAAWRGGPRRPMRALGAPGVRTQANRSRAKTPGAEPGPAVGQNSCHSGTSCRSDSARTSLRCSSLSSVTALSVVFFAPLPLPRPFLGGHNSLRETLSNKCFNMPAL